MIKVYQKKDIYSKNSLNYKLMNNNPSKLLKGNRVDLNLFQTKLKSGQGLRGPDEYVIQKDNARHGGRAWKLKDSKGNRIASLGPNGEVLAG